MRYFARGDFLQSLPPIHGELFPTPVVPSISRAGLIQCRASASLAALRERKAFLVVFALSHFSSDIIAMRHGSLQVSSLRSRARRPPAVRLPSAILLGLHEGCQKSSSSQKIETTTRSTSSTLSGDLGSKRTSDRSLFSPPCDVRKTSLNILGASPNDCS